ncbi:MAG: AMP-binding enzyme, partial [Gammaproteobacteria bacterium]
ADEIRIVDTEDNDLANGQVGELLTRGPYTIRGYFRAAEYNKRTFTNDGFYRTGDIVRKTDQGYLVVEGRIKDQINRGGEKISAAEVENQLMVHESIHDVAIVAMPDPYLGEKSCAFIIISDHVTSQPKAAELRAFLCHRGLADYKLPDRFEFYQELPKTSFGKVNKQALRDILADRLTDATAVQRIERA